jgi:hypothetical protein
VIISTFIYDKRVAQDICSKTELFRDILFSPPSAADLSDISEYKYPKSIEIPVKLSIEEVRRAILRTKKDNASKLDEIPNKVIHLIARYSPKFIMRLFQACLNQGVHPKAFKKATTVILRKDDNKNYLSLKLYRPIALLNTLGKILKAVISNCLYFLAETHALLPNTQMGAQRIKSTDTALQLITEKIHVI